MARSIGRALGIGLYANTDKFSKGIKGAENEIERFKGRVKKVGAAAAAGFAAMGAAAVMFGKQSVQAYLEDQKGQRRLAVALQNTRRATKDQVKAVEDLILKYELQYGVADDKLRPAYQRLIQSTKSYSKTQTALKLAMDISAGSGKDLNQVAIALAKGYDGNTQALSRLGLGLDKGILKSGDMDKITKILAKTFSGQATAAANSYQGKMDRLNLKFVEFKENVGEKLMPVLSTLMDWIMTNAVPKMQAFFDGFTKGKRPLDNATQSAYQFGEKLKNIITWIKDNRGIVAGFATLVASIFTGIKVAAAVSALGKLVGVFRTLTTTAAVAAGAEAAATGGANLALAAGAIAAIATAFGVSALVNLGAYTPDTSVTDTAQYKTQEAAAAKTARQKVKARAKLKIDYIYQGVGYEWDASRGEWYSWVMGNNGTYRDYSNPHPPGAPRATGGPVTRGRPYLVGEHGPEMWVPNGQSGRIVPNNKLGGNTINITLNGIVDADSARRSIEGVLRNSGKRIGGIDLIGSTL